MCIFKLHCSHYSQNDIGLEKFKVAELFLQLSGPTLIVIMTIIQLQYFHNKYVKYLEYPRPNTDNSRGDDTSRSFRPGQDATELDYDNIEDPTIRTNTEKTEAEQQPSMWQKVKGTSKDQWKQYIMEAWEFMWLVLEIHFIKLIMLIAFLVCLNKVNNT